MTLPPLIHLDDTLLAVDKPADLLAVPGRGPGNADCVASRVQAHYPDALIVHRLDMATSGLLLMARGAAMQRALSIAFAERRVRGAVLDEISPGKRDPGGTKSGSATGVAMTPGAVGGSGPAGASAGARQPVYVTRADSTAPFFGGLAFGAAIFSLFAIWVLASATTGANAGPHGVVSV